MNKQMTLEEFMETQEWLPTVLNDMYLDDYFDCDHVYELLLEEAQNEGILILDEGRVDYDALISTLYSEVRSDLS